MNKRITDSPLARKRLTVGADPEALKKPVEEEQEQESKNIKTSKHQDVKPAKDTEMRRTTVYLPEDLFIRFKVYAVRHKEDMSGLIAKQIEKLLREDE